MIISTALAYTSSLPATLAEVKLRARVTGSALDVDIQSAMESAAASLRDLLRSPLSDYSCVIKCRFSTTERMQVLPFTVSAPVTVTATQYHAENGTVLVNNEAYTAFTVEGSNPSRLIFDAAAPFGILTITYTGAARPGLKDAFCLLSAANFFESQRAGSVKAARDAILLNLAPASLDGYQ